MTPDEMAAEIADLKAANARLSDRVSLLERRGQIVPVTQNVYASALDPTVRYVLVREAGGNAKFVTSAPGAGAGAWSDS